MERIFVHPRGWGTRLVVLASLSLVLAYMQNTAGFANRIDDAVINLSAPLYRMLGAPERALAALENTLVPGEKRGEAMARELLEAQYALQSLVVIEAENRRLRNLLGAAERLSAPAQLAELIAVSPDPARHRVIVDRGRGDGVYIGQPLLDAHGLAGQVVAMGENASAVLLITDPSFALPVQVVRNGLKLIVEGRGDLDRLALRHVANNLDLQEGDLLVTSGLGRRFPPGLPVAVVDTVKRDPRRPFAEVWATLHADLTQNRQFLLISPPPLADPEQL